MKRRLGTLGSCALLALLAWRVGTGPFIAGLRDARIVPLLGAVALGALATVCCAWRWTLVARGLGVRLGFRTAVAAYYRSIFLNLTLPGGIVGDVHRGVAHGQAVGDRSRALRAVVSERVAGQIVQALVTVPILLLFPSPVRPLMPWVLAGVAVAAVAMVALARRRRVLRLPRGWLAIAAASTVVVAAHAAAFLLAAHSAHVSAPFTHLLPLTLLSLTAMVLPSVAGWGPREGVTAWAFAAAGLGAQAGITTAVVYGVYSFAAALPGAAVLLTVAWRRHEPHAGPVTLRQRVLHG